jgi:hypothetical protein
MAYYPDLFSPETYEAFGKSVQNISSFRVCQINAARKVHLGDKFLCYMAKFSRWVGILEVIRTAIYSGILRMASLLSLQPNMDIKLHLVSPASRRAKVFQEIQHPVFSLLEKGPLAEPRTFIAYDSVLELHRLKHLAYLPDSVLEEYEELAK